MTSLVDEKLEKYREIQGEIQKLFLSKQQYLSQFNENTLVKGELDLLTEDEQVYKLVGPVLMKVDLEESKENVGKRLQFIEGEITKIDQQIAEKQGSQTTLGEEIAQLQKQMQQQAVLAAREVIEESA
mmetsp:Transcript_17326/g.18067  ORF Transcript_17326/g.18067 Transcript_17326/m.18067 type:complete len:128 (+) Transcript_17326:19-402(+)|eukprot:CAMPEP_0174818394 /NCGR_PEP_ID=MMETSP1107-20130205/1065_1 /TAXON_ID=36770 /ORGANISM="Paraphysomonas vestita, Strain GFlagA" /LENGTH=127 /DNA_ID=CAMNT_0016030171 /DNA_START=14 /DNA_END=400 /DNA_ORIENTATION=+